MGKENKEYTFEESLKNLENIVKKLEGGNLSLDESLEEFQNGVKAYKYCNERLNEVEGKVKLIIEDESTEISELDFNDL